MDDRGRFAHLPPPKSAPPRRRGRLPRWLATLVTLNPPRGVGASAAALLLLAATCYGVVKGGHAETIAARMQDICDDAANSLGFRIAEVAVAGQHEVSRENILALAGITGRSSLLFLDAAKTRARLLGDPWIADASVLKLYPKRLLIGIKERVPFALWQKDGVVSLIAADGTVLFRCRFWSGAAPRAPAALSSTSSTAIPTSRAWSNPRCWSRSGAGTCI
jgi:cell division protein FtsQ